MLNNEVLRTWITVLTTWIVSGLKKHPWVTRMYLFKGYPISGELLPCLVTREVVGEKS